MTEIRTLDRCGKPVEDKAGRPCMRVSGHIGSCIPALLDEQELDELDNITRIDVNSVYGKMPPRNLIPLPKRLITLLIIGVVAIVLLQVWVDGYVIASIFNIG